MNVLCNLTGDYITVKWSVFLNQWIINRETCRKGSIPIGDAWFKRTFSNDTELSEIIGSLTAEGYDQDHILVFADKGE